MNSAIRFPTVLLAHMWGFHIRDYSVLENTVELGMSVFGYTAILHFILCIIKDH